MNNEITSNATNSTETYCTSTTSMVYSVYQTHERSIHDGRRASETRKRTRMETCQKSKERQRVFLRQEMAKRRYLPWPRCQGRGTERGRSQSKAGQGTIKNKACATGRPSTIKAFFIMARSTLREPGKLMRDGPRYSVPVSSIHIPKKLSKVWYSRDREAIESAYVPMDNDIFSSYPEGSHCIYEFDDNRSGDVIYIGLTNDLKRRVKQHLYRKESMIRPLAQNLSVSVIDWHSDLQEARKLEKMWIQRKRPLLNTAHNIASNETYQAEIQAEHISECLKAGLTYKQALLFVENFCGSEGDYCNYKLIRSTAQMTRYRANLAPLTETEVLDLALQVCKIEQ